MTIETNRTLVRINAPEFYKDPGFIQWLNSKGTATWHNNTHAVEPTEMSDVFFTFDAGDGSDAPNPDYQPGPCIPEHIWQKITRALDAAGVDECLVWMSNLQE